MPDLEAEGIAHVDWPHATRAWRPSSDVRAFVELVGIIRRGKFDLVHTHNPKPGIMGRIAARLCGVRCVVNTVHGLYATPGDRRRKRIPVLALEWLASRFSDLELYVSEEDLAWARSIAVVGKSKSALLGGGVDLSFFEPGSVGPERLAELRAELGIEEGALIVGMVGRLVAEKGCREFFQAAREVRAVSPGVRFVIVGGRDPDKWDSLGEAEIEGSREDVLITGWRPDVRDLLALMDVFVLPSWREGVPRSAMEAAAMGKPLVLTDIRGCREVARHGQEALFVPPRNPERLAGAIFTLLADAALRGRLGAAARARAEERFDEGRIGQLVVDSYRELLGRKGLAAPGAPSEAPTPLVIRPARVADAPALARLHRRSLPDAFLPKLGEGFLRQLYRALATDQEAVAVVAEDGDGVAGFAVGVVSVEGFYRRFYRRYGLRAGLAAAPSLIRPSVIRGMWETARYPALNGSGPQAELLVIAVAVRSQSQGIGMRLADEIVGGLRERGAGQVKVVVGADNIPANRFYERIGFVHLADITVHGGRASRVWTTP